MTESSHDDPLAAFGTNQWLVDEMYERYQADPSSVDKAWEQFFAGTTPHEPETNGRAQPDTARIPTEKPQPESAQKPPVPK